MIVKTALRPLQQAIFQQLNNDTNLKPMIKGVFDQVPEGTSLPYVQIGDFTNNPYDTKTDNGEDITLTLHVWSGGPGKTEAEIILDSVLQAMTAAPIVLTGGVFTVDGIRREFVQVFNDGQAQHGVCRFRIYIKQN
jgi:hypothetical protein